MVPGSVLRCTEDNVDRRNYRVEFRRISEAIGFEPVWKIEAGVQQVLDAIASGKVTNYQDPKYSNVKFLSAPDAREHLPVMEDWVPKYMEFPRPGPRQRLRLAATARTFTQPLPHKQRTVNEKARLGGLQSFLAINSVNLSRRSLAALLSSLVTSSGQLNSHSRAVGLQIRPV